MDIFDILKQKEHDETDVENIARYLNQQIHNKDEEPSVWDIYEMYQNRQEYDQKEIIAYFFENIYAKQTFFVLKNIIKSIDMYSELEYEPVEIIIKILHYVLNEVKSFDGPILRDDIDRIESTLKYTEKVNSQLDIKTLLKINEYYISTTFNGNHTQLKEDLDRCQNQLKEFTELNNRFQLKQQSIERKMQRDIDLKLKEELKSQQRRFEEELQKYKTKTEKEWTEKYNKKIAEAFKVIKEKNDSKMTEQHLVLKQKNESLLKKIDSLRERNLGQENEIRNLMHERGSESELEKENNKLIHVVRQLQLELKKHRDHRCSNSQNVQLLDKIAKLQDRTNEQKTDIEKLVNQIERQRSLLKRYEQHSPERIKRSVSKSFPLEFERKNKEWSCFNGPLKRSELITCFKRFIRHPASYSFSQLYRILFFAVHDTFPNLSKINLEKEKKKLVSVLKKNTRHGFFINKMIKTLRITRRDLRVLIRFLIDTTP